jgi:hypothetical protein
MILPGDHSQDLGRVNPSTQRTQQPTSVKSKAIDDGHDVASFLLAGSIPVHTDLVHDQVVCLALSRTTLAIGGFCLFLVVCLPKAEWTAACEIVCVLCFSFFLGFCVRLSRITKICKVINDSHPIAITAMINSRKTASGQSSRAAGTIELISGDSRFNGQRHKVRIIQKRTDSPFSSDGQVVPAQLYLKHGTEQAELVETAELFCLI